MAIEAIEVVNNTMKFTISSPFGAMESFRRAPHTGIDIPLQEGTLLQAIQDGVVTKVYDGTTSLGKGVAIKTEDGTTHIYGHMSEVNADPGQILHAGDVIGASGNTGFSTGPHLHFATRMPNGEYSDPTHFFDELSASFVSSNPSGFGKVIEFFKERGAVNQYSKAAQKGEHPFWNWIWEKICDGSIYLWDLFVTYLPDIMGYGAVLAGITIILGAMVGRGGMIKPLAIYAAGLILALCILGGV